MRLHYQIAGLCVSMETFGRTLDQAAQYLISNDEEPDIFITSSWDKHKSEYPLLSDSDGEYLATGANFYKQLLNFDGMMLHSSAVVVDGKAYLFTADCGTGKSTHTRLWLEKFASRAYILNDDKPAIRIENGIWYAYGTPWSGKEDLSVNARVPIAGIAILERSENNHIELSSDNDAVITILKQVNLPKHAASRAKVLYLVDRLFEHIPIWKLRCNMDISAADISYTSMAAFSKQKEGL